MKHVEDSCLNSRKVLTPTAGTISSTLARVQRHVFEIFSEWIRLLNLFSLHFVLLLLSDLTLCFWCTVNCASFTPVGVHSTL